MKLAKRKGQERKANRKRLRNRLAIKLSREKNNKEDHCPRCGAYLGKGGDREHTLMCEG